LDGFPEGVTSLPPSGAMGCKILHGISRSDARHAYYYVLYPVNLLSFPPD
jgi:hypothetical protein